MSGQRLAADLDGKPAALHAVADLLARDDPFAALPSLLDDEPTDVVLLGLGSGRYAAGAAAARLARAGVPALAEYSSNPVPGPTGPGTLVVAVAVGTAQRELLAAMERHADSAPILLLAEDADSPLAGCADLVVELRSGTEEARTGARGYCNALALLLALASRLGAPPAGASADISIAARRAANATADLLERAAEWVPAAAEALAGPGGLHLLAPAERLASAQQGALAVRKGPVRAAHAEETAEWSHTGRYLAAITDYRALLLCGSRFDERAAEQIVQLRGRFVAVGGTAEGQSLSVRYPGDDDEDVRLLTEPVVAELLAAHWWRERR